MKINAVTSLRLANSNNIKNNISFAKKNTAPSDKTPFFPSRIGFLLPKYQKEYLNLKDKALRPAIEQMKIASDLAREFVIYKSKNLKNAKITFEHFYLAMLLQLLQYSKDIKEGTITYEKDTTLVTPRNISTSVTDALWMPDRIDKTIETLEKEIEKETDELSKKSAQNAFVSSIEIDEDWWSDIKAYLKFVAQSEQDDYNTMLVDDSAFASAMLFSSDRNKVKKIRDLLEELAMCSMKDEIKENSAPLPFYEDISLKVLKSLDKNFNVIVTYSTNDTKAPEYFTRSLVETIKNGNLQDLKNINSDNSEIVYFNKNAKLQNLSAEIEKLAKNKDKNYIIVVESLAGTLVNSSTISNEGLFYDPEIFKRLISKKYQNIHLIFLDSQDAYYNTLSNKSVASQIEDFQNIQLPIMDNSALKEQLIKTKSFIEQEIGMPITPEALEYAGDLFSDENSSKYDKVVKNLKNIAVYFVNKDILTKDDINSYWESSQEGEGNLKDSTCEIMFDTKMTLDDILGSPMTKKQAELVSYEIKNFPKTKGYILYNVDGFGGGRLNCAKAIAGDAKIPMICINASDFAIRDLDTINQNPMDAIQVKMKKLIDSLRAQAQANPNKTAMLFISNFDNFASNPIYGISSIYEQQAFSKLIKEMKKASSDKSYNLIVMGASDHPELISENILRPGLFMDEIQIYPPNNSKNIIEIAKKYIEEKNYSLSGKSEKENKEILRHLANVISGSGYVDIIDIIDRAFILAKKDKRDSISIKDINQAYFIKTIGMPSEIPMDNRQKGLIIRHEGGHALNLQFMYNLLKEEGDTLKIPDAISNITLDPRGDYLGCVFHNLSEENQTDMNLETIFSGIVCDFGGNSAEELFYGQQGSWGISEDMKNANYRARLAVLNMALGARMGYFIPDIDPSSNLPALSYEDEQKYTKDIKTILFNAKFLSDEIVDCYSEFLNELAKKYIPDFASGNCVITGNDFNKMLKNWENKQPKKVKKQIKQLKKTALEVIEATRKGKKYKV